MCHHAKSFLIAAMLYRLPGFDWIKRPLLHGIGASIANELLDDIAHALRVVLILQNGALIGSLVVGVYAPRIGDALFFLVYAAIVAYGVYSFHGQRRFFVFILECGSVRKAIGRELLAQVQDRLGLVGLMLGSALLNLPSMAHEVGDYVWKISKGMLQLAALILALNLLVVRMMIIPALHHRLIAG
jgi:hypothetical protein